MSQKETEFPSGDLHIGRLIKEELSRQGRTATWLAHQVHCSPENIYKLCKQKWVSMPLLFQISLSLQHNFFKDCSDCLCKSKKTNF